MEKLVEKGLVRSIGVSNFNSEQLKRVLEVATIKPVMNQVCINGYKWLSNETLCPYIFYFFFLNRLNVHQI